MGLAMVAIVLFHTALPRSDMFFGLRRMGNIGVDIFFFLSGIGLWFAWTKHPSLRRFYGRRLLRIAPAWVLLATAFYLPDYLGAQRMSSSLPDLIGDVTVNWGFWQRGELTFWYIPATLVLYALAPFYMQVVRKCPPYKWLIVVMIMWCFAVQYVPFLRREWGYLEIFWSRIPIFFIGINLGEKVQNKAELDGRSVWLLAFVAAVSLAFCIYLEQALHGRFPLFIERMAYIPLTISTLLLLGKALDKAGKALLRPLVFIGSVSLETYLIHAHFVLVHLEKARMGYWPTALLCIVITLPLAWLVHKAIAMTINKWQQKH